MRRTIIEPLNSILEAREERAILKIQLTQKQIPCVSLSLNVPGFPKSNVITKAFFCLCLNDLKYYLTSHLIKIDHQKAVERCDMAGEFFIAPFQKGIISLTEVKQICEDFEERHPLGRFIDVDLNNENGQTISSGKSKLCFFCQEKPAVICRRENSHDQELVREFMFSQMAAYCSKQREADIATQLSSLALKALLYEISLSPKPGLVDKFSNGSHVDMNYQTFIDSTSVISSWFNELLHEGFSFGDHDLSKALPLIRNIGLRMESAMYKATGNTNTQKGIIFLMGITLFACGKLFLQNDLFEVEQFRTFIKDICKDMVSNELLNCRELQPSHGEDIYQKYGIGGARAEAESGLQTVFDYGLPPLMGVAKLTDETMIKSFLSIASHNVDTNILYRGGPHVLSVFQKLCSEALENYNDQTYLKVIDFCRKENISPGGSADLLALSIFIWNMMNNTFLPKYSA